MVCGVAQTIQHDDEDDSIHFVYFVKRSAPGMRPMPDPQVVVGREEQHADEQGLDDPEPAHEAAHHRDAHLLVVLVDLAAQPVAGEGQDDEGARWR